MDEANPPRGVLLEEYRFLERLNRATAAAEALVACVRDRVPQKVEIPLVSTAARLVVDSTPKGAQVLINGVQRGETPLTLETVGAGDQDRASRFQRESHRFHRKLRSERSGFGESSVEAAVGI